MSKNSTKPILTRKDFAEEDRRMKKLREQGWSEAKIKSWLRGWRLVGGAK